MNVDLEKVANVLDALANYIDGIEREKQAGVTAEREQLIAAIGEKYAAATGEDISDDVLRKLASSDVALLHTLDKIAETRREDISLGSPSDQRDQNSAPESKKEAAEAADDQFVNWILS